MKPFQILLAGLSVLLGTGLWVAGIWVLVEHQLFLLRGVESVAAVVKLEESTSGPGSREPGTVFYSPILRFTASSGKEVEFRTGWASRPPEYEVGERVEIAYSETDPDNARVARFEWSGVGLICFGTLFLFLGGRVFYARLRNKKLLRTGTPICTTLFKVTLNSSVSVNDQNPWVIVTQWRDPSTRAKRFFHSENLWSDPIPQLADHPIVVYVDPKRPEHYTMDVSFLRGKRTRAKAAPESNTRGLTADEEARVLRGLPREREQQEATNEGQGVSAFVLDGRDLKLCLNGPLVGSPTTPKEALKEARGQRVFVHFDRRKASGATSVGHPTHAVLLIEDFKNIKIGVKRLRCTLEGGEACAVPWEAIFAIVVPSTERGLVWLRVVPVGASITDRAKPARRRRADDPAQAPELALAQQLPVLAVNGEEIPDGEFELLVDGEWFPGITAVTWGGVLGFFMKVRLSGSTGPLMNYVKARSRAEKRPAFFVELAYETKSRLGRGAFTACTWTSEQADEADGLTFRPSSYQWATQSKASALVRTRWGY